MNTEIEQAVKTIKSATDKVESSVRAQAKCCVDAALMIAECSSRHEDGLWNVINATADMLMSVEAQHHVLSEALEKANRILERAGKISRPSKTVN